MTAPKYTYNTMHAGWFASRRRVPTEACRRSSLILQWRSRESVRVRLPTSERRRRRRRDRDVQPPRE